MPKIDGTKISFLTKKGGQVIFRIFFCRTRPESNFDRSIMTKRESRALLWVKPRLKPINVHFVRVKPWFNLEPRYNPDELHIYGL